MRFHPVGEFSTQNSAISVWSALRAVHVAQPIGLISLKSRVYSAVITAAALEAAPYGAGARNCVVLWTPNGFTTLPHSEASANPPVPKKSKPGVLNGKV